MPMLMLKCKTCGIIFSSVYTSDMKEFTKKSKSNSNGIHSCSRGHSNEYSLENYIDLSWIFGSHIFQNPTLEWNNWFRIGYNYVPITNLIINYV